VVAPPPGSDVYLLARLWSFWPILELEKGKTYRLHLTAMDYNHGFSLQPANINIQMVPGFEHVVTVTPNQSGHLLGRVQRILRHRPSHRWSAASTSSEGRR
jgi:cytochrome c oxidase subunit 2